MEEETKQAIQAIGDAMFARAEGNKKSMFAKADSKLGVDVDGHGDNDGGDGDGSGYKLYYNDRNEGVKGGVSKASAVSGDASKASAVSGVSKASAVSGDASLQMGMLKFHQISYENASHGVLLYKDAFKRRVFR